MGNWILWLIMGIIALLGGIFAIANPLAATLTATALAAWVFMLVGILQVIGGFGVEGIGWKIWNILLGVLAIYIAIVIFNNPLKGVLTLTAAVAIGFFIGGIFKVVFAFQTEGSLRWVLILSGIISVILAGMIWSNFPQSAAVVLGVLLAVELISSGVALIARAFAVRGANEA